MSAVEARIRDIEADIQALQREFDRDDEKADAIWDEIVRKEAELDKLEEELEEIDEMIYGAEKEIGGLLTGGGALHIDKHLDSRGRHMQAIEQLETMIGAGVEDPEDLEMLQDELENEYYWLHQAERHDAKIQEGGKAAGNYAAAQVALLITLVTLAFLG